MIWWDDITPKPLVDEIVNFEIYKTENLKISQLSLEVSWDETLKRIGGRLGGGVPVSEIRS